MRTVADNASRLAGATNRKVMTAAMEGGGFYNRNSDFQAAGIALALPLLKKAASSIPVDGSGPLVIADYGSSQGRNSVLPIRVAIDELRARAGPDRSIEVVHTDLPSNDFTSLFTLLRDDPESYLQGQTGIFPSAVGRSYFEPIVPPGRVHLGWSSWALHWMSRNPVDVPDATLAVFSASSSAREAVARQLAEDWRCFLLARSLELRTGAKLVTLSIGRTSTHHGWEWIAGEVWQTVMEMGREGLLSPAEQLRITLPIAGRSVEDVKAPFAEGAFAHLSLEHVAVIEAPDPYWDSYRETGNAHELGQRWAGMQRAVIGPVVAAALEPGRDANAILDDLFCRYAARIAAWPKRNASYVVVAVIGKSAAASWDPTWLGV